MRTSGQTNLAVAAAKDAGLIVRVHGEQPAAKYDGLLGQQ